MACGHQQQRCPLLFAAENQAVNLSTILAEEDITVVAPLDGRILAARINILTVLQMLHHSVVGILRTVGLELYTERCIYIHIASTRLGIQHALKIEGSIIPSHLFLLQDSKFVSLLSAVRILILALGISLKLLQSLHIGLYKYEILTLRYTEALGVNILGVDEVIDIFYQTFFKKILWHTKFLEPVNEFIK